MKITGVKKAAGATKGISYTRGERVDITLHEDGHISAEYRVGGTRAVWSGKAVTVTAELPVSMAAIRGELWRAAYTLRASAPDAEWERWLDNVMAALD